MKREAFRVPAVRVGLGFMRQSTDEVRDEARAEAVVHAALDEGLTLFDTAHAYGQGEHEYGHNERWLGAFLRRHPRGGEARVITKGGMRRSGPRYAPDGRAATLRAQCEASVEALGRPIDLYLLHAVDPRTPLATSVRALIELRDAGLVRDIGLSNCNRTQLDEALALTPLGGVQLAVSLLDDTALRGGVVQRALEAGVPVLCHSPLGGPKRFAQLAKQAWLVERAQAAGCTPHEWALASLLSLHPQVVVLPGARRVETVRSARRAAGLDVLGVAGANTTRDGVTAEEVGADARGGPNTTRDGASSAAMRATAARDVSATAGRDLRGGRDTTGDGASPAMRAATEDVSATDLRGGPDTTRDGASPDARGATRGPAGASDVGRVPDTTREARSASEDGPHAHGATLAAPRITPREVRLLMGLQGAGKSSAVEALVREGWARLNRDTEGGTLEQLHRKLELLLIGGTPRVVLDNTYVTRAQRGSVIQVARRHGVPVHGVWHDIEPAQAQINVVTRMLDVHGRLLTPLELKRGKTPDALSPRGHFATLRGLEPLGDDEGFAQVTRVPFTRRPWAGGRPALFLGLELLSDDGTWSPEALAALKAHAGWVPVVVGWREGGLTAPRDVENAVCPHAGGPPECWCRPPLPGLVLERSRALGLSLGESRFVTTSRVLEGLADALAVRR